MTRPRTGFALPAAIAALVVLSALAALANIAARVALREGEALAGEAQARATRAGLRARAALALSHASRDELIVAPKLIGARDTAIVTVALAWPWHRVAVTDGVATVIAELARATAPVPPWCAAVVVGAASSVAPGSVSLDPASSCVTASLTATPVAITAFDDSLSANLTLPSPPDSVTIYTGGTPAVVRARFRATIAAGATVTGIVVAPVVTLEAGATVSGMVVAAQALRINAGATAIGDERATERALRAHAKLHFLGRAGLLLPP